MHTLDTACHGTAQGSVHAGGAGMRENTQEMRKSTQMKFTRRLGVEALAAPLILYETADRPLQVRGAPASARRVHTVRVSPQDASIRKLSS